jgi:tetratricopeptide (TPR) repeat protein
MATKLALLACAASLALLANPAWALLDENMLEPTQDLKSLNKYGADKLRFRFHRDETFWLQGLKGGRIIWEKRFPLDGTINAAKTWIECKGQQINVVVEQPWSAMQHMYEFSWDGSKLKYLRQENHDPTEEAIAKATSAALSGNPKAVVYAADASGYSDRYIDGSVISDLLEQGHKVALNLFKEGKKQEAESRSKLVFDTTYTLITMRGELDKDESKKESDLQKWLEAWHLESLGLTSDSFLGALNDYGYFLQENGKDKDAIEVFKAVLKEDDSRSVAYLNLADSLYKLGETKESGGNYKSYTQQISKSHDADKIPARAYERAGLPVPVASKPDNKPAPAPRPVGSGSKPKNVVPNAQKKNDGPDYAKEAVEQPGFRWNSADMPVKVFIERPTTTIGFREEDIAYLKEAFQDWAKASVGLLKFEFVESDKNAQIKCSWTNNSAALIDAENEGGQALVDAKKDGIKSATIIMLTRNSAGVFSEDLVRLTCLHEVGHALGLTGHSTDDLDVMYGELADDGRTKLSDRDVATIRKIYSDPKPIDLTDYVNSLAINRQGIELTNAGDIWGATKKFEQAVALAPNLRPGKQNLGHAYFQIAKELVKQGKDAQADNYFQKAIVFNKSGYRRQLYVQTLEAYSELLNRLGRKKEAEEKSAEAFGVKMGLMD